MRVHEKIRLRSHFRTFAPAFVKRSKKGDLGMRQAKHTTRMGWLVIGYLTVMTVSPSILADGFRNPPDGAATLGRVGARIAGDDDIASFSHNPATLADRRERAAGTALTFVHGKRTFTSDRHGFTTRSTDRWAYIPSFYTALPLGDRGVAAGIALTSPYGRSSSFSETGPMRYLAPYESRLRTANMNPAIGVRVSERLAAGAGLNVMWSDLEIRQIVPGAMLTGNPADAWDGRLAFDADGIGYGFNMGLTLDVSLRQRFALIYRSAITMDYEGDVTLRPISAPAILQNDFETSITFPDVIAAGYAVRAMDDLYLEINIEWVQHSRFDRMDLDAGEATALLPESSIKADWRDNWTFGIGADWRMSDAWSIRAGYMYLQSPVRSRTMIPLIAESDQSVVSLGVGHAYGAHRFDLAYMLGIFERRRVEDNVNPEYNGTYDFDSQLFAIGYHYTF